MKRYNEGRVIFDRYLENSLKTKTREKRSQKTSALQFEIHEEMNIAKVSLKELLSYSRTKSQLTELLALEFKDSDQVLVVSYENLVKSNNAQLSPDDLKTHTQHT